MGPPVLITEEALEDLRSIATFIAAMILTAIRFGDALIDKALTPSSFPEMGRIVPEFKDPSIREIISGAYRIVYRRPNPAHIEVLRFWHAARGTPIIS
jgi:toxin ParE1/3/4